MVPVGNGGWDDGDDWIPRPQHEISVQGLCALRWKCSFRQRVDMIATVAIIMPC